MALGSGAESSQPVFWQLSWARSDLEKVMNAGMEVHGWEQLKALCLLDYRVQEQIRGCATHALHVVPAVNPASEQLQGAAVVVWLWWKTTLRNWHGH